MTASIGALWGTPPVPAAQTPDSASTLTAAGGDDAGSSFKAIAERLAKAAAAQDEPAATDDAAVAQAVVPLVPIAVPPPSPEWALPKGDAETTAPATAANPGSATVTPPPAGLPAALPDVFPADPMPTAPAPAPHALQPESLVSAAAPRPAPPLDLGPADAFDAGTNGVERPRPTAPRPEPAPLPASPPALQREPVPAPVLDPEVLQGRDAIAALAPRVPELQPGGLSVSGMHAAQEALLRPVRAVGPRSAATPVAGTAPETVATPLPAAIPSSVSGDLPATPNDTVLGLAVRRTPIAVARPEDVATADSRRTPAAAVAERVTRRTPHDPIDPPGSAASRGLATAAPVEARMAFGMVTANGPREMQFQAEPHVQASQAPEMIATQERIAAEMAALVRTGGGEARLDLEPAELGKLRLRLAVRNHVVEGSITVENPAVKAALEANMQGLVVALERTGLNCERMEIRLLDSRRGQERRDPKRDSETAPQDEPGKGDAPATARTSSRRGSGSGLVDYWF